MKNSNFFINFIFVNMASCNYWDERFVGATGTYTCPWCDRDLKPKVSQSAKNPGKSFVSCSRDYGGCGLFSFLNDQPNEKFKPNGNKRGRAEGGNNIVGPIVNRPSVTDERLAELATKIDELTTVMHSVRDEIMNELKQ